MIWISYELMTFTCLQMNESKIANNFQNPDPVYVPAALWFAHPTITQPWKPIQKRALCRTITIRDSRVASLLDYQIPVIPMIKRVGCPKWMIQNHHNQSPELPVWKWTEFESKIGNIKNYKLLSFMWFFYITHSAIKFFCDIIRGRWQIKKFFLTSNGR